MNKVVLDCKVGQAYDGRIINLYQGNVIVELGDGIIGRILNGAGEIEAAIGDAIRVVVTENNSAGITLSLAKPEEEAQAAQASAADADTADDADDDADDDKVLSPDQIRPWDDWNHMQSGHKQAVTAMSGLRAHTQAFRDDLTAARSEWEHAKESSQSVYDTIVNSATAQANSDINILESTIKARISSTESRLGAVNDIINACQSFQKRAASNDVAHNAIDAAYSNVNQAQQAVQRAVAEKKQALQQLKNCQIADTVRKKTEKIDKARQEQIDRDKQSELHFNAQNRRIRINGRRDITVGFNHATVRAYAQDIRASRFHAENYECPQAVPEYIMLGNIGLHIPQTAQDDMPVVQAVEAQAEEFGSKQDDAYCVEIPYAQRLSDGISLLIRYAPSDRIHIQGLIQPLLLKLFLSFPAGKLEATMIDPLELGASFPDIPKLGRGPNAARIIDTKIWSKERDIENAIATLRQRLENMTQAYGGDQESRLKKEVIRALAITDFPVGFSDAALKDLHAIVRNSASLGVCVLICANDEELEKLRKKNGTLLTEITQSVVETHAQGSLLMLAGSKYQNLYLRLDDMSDVMANKAAILQQISAQIDRGTGTKEYFEDMYDFDVYDSNNWFTGNHDEVAIPLGVKGAHTVVKMVLGRGGGSTEHHALIAGQTGAGKSTLLHTLIMSTLISYSPDEVQMYLLDFKEGVEFSAYTRYRLPSLRVVAVNSEREFGLAVLKELCTELETRTKHFTRYGVSDINSYTKLPDVPKVPKLLLIFDEVQELFRSAGNSDSISAECLSCLNKLVMQGRAMGIHVILACQDFHNCAGLEAYFSQMAIRIAVKGSEVGAASILNADNAGIRALQNQAAGAAIYNGGGGVESANNFFQVAYIDEEHRLMLLEKLNEYYQDPAVDALYHDQQTRTLLTNAEDDVHNCFNQFICSDPGSVHHLAKAKDGYGLLLGLGFGKKSIFMPELQPKDRDNLLIVSRDEKTALSLCELSAMSVLYEELNTNADKENALVYILDLFADELSNDECDFDTLEAQFPQQVKVAKVGEAETLISDLYEIVLARAEGRAPVNERIFLIFFGINRARRLRASSIYDDSNEETLSPLEKLQVILSKGPRNGINSIVWGENIRSLESMLGDRYDATFDKRIAFGLDDASMDTLVAESEPRSLHSHTAVYMDISRDVKNTHFRPYDIPAKIWVEQYAQAYDSAIHEQA